MLPSQPGRFQTLDLPVDGTILIMCATEVAGTYQKLTDNLATGKQKGLLKKLLPFLRRKGMMMVQPRGKRTFFFPNPQQAPRIFDCRIPLHPVANDACVCQQP